MPFIQLVIAAINLIHHIVQYLNHEGKFIHHLVLVQDVVHAHISYIVEDRTEDK